MPRCHLTGIEFELRDGYVLNRREAHQLLDRLRERVASLDRLIAQLGPVDSTPDPQARVPVPRSQRSDKRHRLVCKAVADALSCGYTEIALFMSWSAYCAQAQPNAVRHLNAIPTLAAIVSTADQTQFARASRLTRDLLRRVDPEKTITARARSAITAAMCLQPSPKTTQALERFLQDSAKGCTPNSLAGLNDEDLRRFAALAKSGACRASKPKSSTTEVDHACGAK